MIDCDGRGTYEVVQRIGDVENEGYEYWAKGARTLPLPCVGGRLSTVVIDRRALTCLVNANVHWYTLTESEASGQELRIRKRSAQFRVSTFRKWNVFKRRIFLSLASDQFSSQCYGQSSDRSRRSKSEETPTMRLG